MRATFMYGAGDVRVETVPEPRIIEPSDAVIRVVRACVCGSDLHRYRALPQSEVGRPMGHEAIGVVEEVGAAVRTLRPGDFVVTSFSFQDNTCRFCREGLQTACVQGGFYGVDGVGGLQAEYARIPQADGTLVVVPGVDPDSAGPALIASLLTLSDVYLTGYHAAAAGGVEAGSTVAVIGDGAVGLSAVLAAHERGAERIILMGRHQDRTGLGERFGATDVVASRGAEGIAAVRELTGGDGAGIVIEAVGLLPAYEQAVGILRPGGIISRVGVPQYEDAPIGFGSLFGRHGRLTGGVAPVRAYMERAIGRVLDGTIEPGLVFDLTVTLEDSAAGYRAMDQRQSLKAMITT